MKCIASTTVQGKRRTKSYKVHKVEQVPKEEWVRVEHTHEPIIDKETFKKAQELSKRDKGIPKNKGIIGMGRVSKVCRLQKSNE